MSQSHKPVTMQVKLNLAQLGITGRLALIALVTKVAPQSPLYASDPEVKTAVDAVAGHGPTLTAAGADAEAKRQAATTSLVAREVEVAAADADLDVFRAIAEKVCKTEADLHTLGVSRRVKAPAVALQAPAHVATAPAKKVKGAIAARAQRIAGLSKYICAISVDPATPTSWQVLAGTAARRTITGLDSGKLYWIRYCTERGSVRSDWSTPVQCVAS
jgi:hypothetical protein